MRRAAFAHTSTCERSCWPPSACRVASRLWSCSGRLRTRCGTVRNGRRPGYGTPDSRPEPEAIALALDWWSTVASELASAHEDLALARFGVVPSGHGFYSCQNHHAPHGYISGQRATKELEVRRRRSWYGRRESMLVCDDITKPCMFRPPC